MNKQTETPGSLDASDRYHYLRKPINRSVACAMSGAPDWAKRIEDSDDRGEQGQFQGQIDAALRGENQNRPSYIPDRQGFRSGRITVIKFSHMSKSSKKKKYFWLVKCDCGTYEIRKHSFIGDQSCHPDMCEQCRKNEKFKEIARLDGSRPLTPLK